MLSDNQIKQLISENELLQLQLQDLNEMIKVREEELQILRNTAAHAVSLQSMLDVNLDEFEQMQSHINLKDRTAKSASKRESTLEEEVFQSIKMETAYYDIKDEFASAKAALADLSNEVAQTASLYKQIATLTSRVAELESNLEIAALDNSFLKEELESYRKERASSARHKKE